MQVEPVHQVAHDEHLSYLVDGVPRRVSRRRHGLYAAWQGVLVAEAVQAAAVCAHCLHDSLGSGAAHGLPCAVLLFGNVDFGVGEHGLAVLHHAADMVHVEVRDDEHVDVAWRDASGFHAVEQFAAARRPVACVEQDFLSFGLNDVAAYRRFNRAFGRQTLHFLRVVIAVEQLVGHALCAVVVAYGCQLDAGAGVLYGDSFGCAVSVASRRLLGIGARAGCKYGRSRKKS